MKFDARMMGHAPPTHRRVVAVAGQRTHAYQQVDHYLVPGFLPVGRSEGDDPDGRGSHRPKMRLSKKVADAEGF